MTEYLTQVEIDKDHERSYEIKLFGKSRFYLFSNLSLKIS